MLFGPAARWFLCTAWTRGVLVRSGHAGWSPTMGLLAALFALVLGLVRPSPAADDDNGLERVRERFGAGASKRSKRSCWALGEWLRRTIASAVWAPRHVAIILDGNRRYAAKLNLERTQGHQLGFDTLHETLEWCFDVGVKTLTVYAFSIENFKRPQKEVDTLMALAKDKLAQMLHHTDLVTRYQVRVCVMGDLSLLPPDVRDVVERVTSRTAQNSGPRLNLCFPYTSSHEMLCAVRSAISSAAGNPDRVTVASFERSLFTGTDFPDLLIRTASQTRLSDFLLYQTGHAQFAVYSCLWPEFTWRHLYGALLSWQLFRLRRNT